MLVWLKRTLGELATGAAVGFVAWCLMGKSITSMWFGSPGGTVTCQSDVVMALDRFVSMQLYSAIIGAVAAILCTTLFRRWWAKARAKSKVATAAPGPVP